ncbi:uncharacterized protein CC84DRAFT_1168833 [Paraphaeosphaeria sporulosa]|uniref:Zn(2)-C6 fungal-type domain-containing protein n=1 Tax=Paraphaeosphaeria sporulosa TaxID=1460663 RepID=A0A177BWY7_9PLEO|nr:uncharacterized protein CC84DRAFT_1168833 [Paraphaeosphaeria sporulosa]OAF99922.1 hypothetical protein CC84DRAFT_1168833 [Paraphaeosphaeria sporulosa]
MGDEASSPKRKKVRAKYASRACVSCRRSKLKCSGENPCQRCVDNGKRCFYSEDQTAAEALQNLSRPTPVHAPSDTTDNGNATGAARRSLLPQGEGVERRASDASVLGMSIEARMARIESMMDSLILERARTATPRTSMERDAAASDRLHADFLMQIAGEATMSAFPPIAEGDLDFDNGPARLRHSLSAVSPASSADAAATIRVGHKTLAFPNPAEYQRYLDIFFDDIAPYYPCVNELDFRINSEKLLSAPAIQADHVSLLALNYIVFACSDIATSLDVASSPSQVSSPGWQWFRAADELVGKRKLSGQVDLCLIQFLALEAVYLMYADKGNAAYSIIGQACRNCFLAGLHQQSSSSWRSYTPFEIHMRQRIFWTVYFLDRRISLSCCRPYSIRESDIDIEQPAYLYDKEIHPDRPLPDLNIVQSSNVYLNCMVCWGRLAADVWDGTFAAAMSKDRVANDNALILDARIKHWTDVILPTIPLLPHEFPPEPRQLRQHTIVQNSLDQLRLLLFRQTMLSLRYDPDVACLCRDLAINIVQRIKNHQGDVGQPTSFRFPMASCLGGAMLILATLNFRDMPCIPSDNHSLTQSEEAYGEATSILADLSPGLALARRIKKDFADLESLYRQTVDPTELNFGNDGPVERQELFPYTSLDFTQQFGFDNEADANNRHTNGSSSASTLNTDLWSSIFATKEGKYGVPWM